MFHPFSYYRINWCMHRKALLREDCTNRMNFQGYCFIMCVSKGLCWVPLLLVKNKNVIDKNNGSENYFYSSMLNLQSPWSAKMPLGKRGMLGTTALHHHDAYFVCNMHSRFITCKQYVITFNLKMWMFLRQQTVWLGQNQNITSTSFGKKFQQWRAIIAWIWHDFFASSRSTMNQW